MLSVECVNLAQAEGKQAKNSDEEAAMEKKLRQEVLAEEAVLQEEKQWHSAASVGYSAGKWSLRRVTKTGVFGSQCCWQSVIQKKQSPEQWQQR